jgi:hypothetical protein
LIESFGIRNPRPFRLVVTFVDKDGTIVLNLIAIRSVWAHGHKDHRVVPLQPEIHAALEARAFFLAHLNVGDDITSHASTPEGT